LDWQKDTYSIFQILELIWWSFLCYGAVVFAALAIAPHWMGALIAYLLVIITNYYRLYNHFNSLLEGLDIPIANLVAGYTNCIPDCNALWFTGTSLVAQIAGVLLILHVKDE
jgi:hypothetical protein